MWPSSSPDLNPLDYGVWGVLEARACDTSHRSVEALKKSVNLEWSNVSEKFIISTCSNFRSRLEKVVAAGGGHIED